MASMSVSGIVSGMDWESMIDEIITNAAKPAQVKVNKKTNLTNKKSLFEEMKVTMNSLQSSLSPLKLPSTYKAKTIDIERIDKNTSYKGVLTATANADAEVNVWDLTVNQLATAQINRSKQINDSNLTSTLNGVSGKTIYINAGGQKVGVEVKSSDTLESLKSRINTTLKTLESPIYVTASVVDNKLLLKSDYTGLGTMTGRETINYNYSTGINRLSNLSIPEEAYDNVKITSSGKSYTIHKDFEIANGNEIRWKQYDRGNEVALGDTATVTYTMAGSDVYTKTGTYRTSEASVTGFSVKDMGTLANRLKITGTDENGDTVDYVYGKDFTLDTSGKVKWLEAAAPTTNEPSSYTVSYTNTVQKAYTASGDKISPMKVPASYTVSYDKVMQADVSVNLTGVDLNANASGNFPTYAELKSVYGLNDIAGNNQNKLDFNGSSADKVEIVIGGSVNSSYSYGTDFIIKKASYGPLNPLSGTSNAAITWERPSVAKPSGSYSVRYTHTYDATAGDGTYDADLAEIISEAGANTGNIKITGADGTEYVNGVHFKIENGGITWKITEEVIDVDDTEFAELQTKYAEATGSELATKTLIDGNGVLRTYVNPEDTSLFTMSVGGVDYEYGRDYVLRVNDAGTGYLFDWLVDDGNSIADANTSVATYAAYRNINTSSWKAAPTDGTAYNFGFNYDYASTSTGTVNKTATDKKLSTVLKGTSVNSSDYSSLVITSGTKKYYYGVDFGIDSTGSIVWRNSDSGSMPTSYTVNYAAKTVSPTSAGTLGSGFPNIDALTGTYGFQTIGNSNMTLDVYNSDSPSDYEFVITPPDANGDYVYGRDYVIQKVGSPGNRNALIAWSSTYIDPYKNYVNSHPADYDQDAFNAVNGTRLNKPTSNYTVSFVRKADSSDLSGVSACINEANGNYSNLTITDNNGKTYTYVASTASLTDDTFTIVDGLVTFKTAEAPKHPTGEYTLTYEAFDAIESTYTYSPAGNDVSINVSSGNGNIGGNKLSYEQILKYVDIAPTSETPQSKIDGSMEKYFTLTDDTKTYTYGTDYRIIKDTTQDSDSSEYQPMIEWISGGLRPSGNFKLTYGTDGGETISTSVTRDASDTLSTVAYNNIKSSTVTITQGSKTYYEGVDFNLSGDSSNVVVVTWKSDKKDGYEWYYPNPGSSYTLNVEDSSGTTTTYSGRRANTDTLDMFAKFGMATAGGTISFQYGDGNSPILDVEGSLGSGHDIIASEYAVDITHSDTGFNFRWLTPKLTTHSNLPSMNDELTVEYQYDANTFDLSDDGDGDLLYALGFTKSDGSYDDYTKAQGAEIVLNGETIEVDSNDIGADYDNEIIKGVTLHLKGTGEVTLDISHDAEKAVESIQSFVDNYNDLMTWMNTRMTEKELDKDTAATVDSDDFRMRWGLLHGNSLLRQTKSQMRSLTSKNFTFTFTQRKSSEEIYGSMAFNGLKTASTLRLRIGSKYVDITIDPSDTLETIVAKLSDDTKNGPMHDFYYDENGQKLQSPLIKASVENDKLEIHSTDNQEITMSGSAAMNALKMNYTYKGLYQIGIESTSDDYGKSGELVFDTDEFMTALEDNPDEVQALMTSFVSEFSAWTSSMLSTSSSGETKGTLTREIDNIQSQIDTINEYLERYQERLDRMEENLRTRYGNTETQFSKLSQQANSIAAILNQLNGTASGGGYGQASS